jgi:DNA replication protein DnaC
VTAYADPAPPGRDGSLLPDASLRSARFEDLDPSRVRGCARAAEALEAWCLSAAGTQPDGSGGPASGLVLQGDTGTGKTHLLNAAARRLSALLPPGPASTGYRVILLGEAQLHAHVRGCWSRGEPFPERLRAAVSGRNRSWLFLDDLGTEASDERWCAEMADLLILRHASRFRALTVVSTNLTLPRIEERYGARCASRLRETLLLHRLEGDDQRRPRRPE